MVENLQVNFLIKEIIFVSQSQECPSFQVTLLQRSFILWDEIFRVARKSTSFDAFKASSKQLMKRLINQYNNSKEI